MFNTITFILSLLGACTWIPFIITRIAEYLHPINCSLFDYKFIQNAHCTGRNLERKQGTILTLALNFYLDYKSFFVNDYNIQITLSNKSNLNCELVGGKISFKASENNKIYYYCIPEQYDFNIHHEINVGGDNIRVIHILLENTSIQSLNDIETISFSFLNKKMSKNIILKNINFPNFNDSIFLNNFIKIEPETR